MHICDVSFDKDRLLFDEIVYRLDTPSDITFVISDLVIDCPYYTWDTRMQPNDSVWISPLHPSLMSIVKSTDKFFGFKFKIFMNRRLVQSIDVPCNSGNAEKKINFVTNDFDIVGPSYLDFFYGTLCKNMDTSGVVIDAGANVGFFTLYALQNGASKVYSIEADVYPFSYLEKNFSNNPNVTLINKALTTDCLGTNFFYTDNSVGSSVNKAEVGCVVGGKIDSINLDTLLAVEKHINLIKLDVEGSEYGVLESLSNTQFNQVNQWFIEFHNKPHRLVKRLNDAGFHTEYRNSDENSTVGFIYARK